MNENNETNQTNVVEKQTVVENTTNGYTGPGSQTAGQNTTSGYTRTENQTVGQNTTGSRVYEKTVVGNTGEGNLKARRIVYFILGIIEILLGARFVLKLLGAGTGNAFVQFIYSVTNALLWPFSGIFRTAVNTGIETKSIMEPATIIAVIVYGIVAWGIVKLIEILKKSNVSK